LSDEAIAFGRCECLLLAAALLPLATASAEQPAKMSITAPEFKDVDGRTRDSTHLRGDGPGSLPSHRASGVPAVDGRRAGALPGQLLAPNAFSGLNC
jgi:hypothetical protein